MATNHRKSKPDGDRLPPHSPEAEQGVLGCILLEPAACIEEARGKLKSSEAFYDLRHQTIYDTALRLADDDIESFDIIALQQRLKDGRKLESVGGLAYLNALPDTVPSAANLSYYLDIVQEKYTLRRLLHTCADLTGRVQEHEGDVKKLLEIARRDFDRAVGDDKSGNLCEHIGINELDSYDLKNDPSVLIGNGYCCIGESIITSGASGRGKSSLLMMRIMLWALGRPWFGVAPVRPMKFVVWQTENNRRSLARAFQGARDALGLSSFDAKVFNMLDENIQFKYCPALTGIEFLNFVERHLMRHPVDFSVLDPLVSFSDEDLNTQKGAAAFIRKGLFRISFRTGVAWLINHHTPKPLRQPDKNAGRKRISDYQYSGAGSFDIAGSFRAVETLEESTDGVFRFVFAKRDGHGATHPDGQGTSMLWLRHATEGKMHWEQLPPPEEAPEDGAAPAKAGGRPSKQKEIAAMNLYSFCHNCNPDGEGLNEVAKRLENWLAGNKDGNKVDASINTCKRAIAEMVSNGKLTKGQDGKYRKGDQA